MNSERNVLAVLEKVPLLGPLLVRDGSWRPVVVFIVIFSVINALIFTLILSTWVDNDGLISVSEGEKVVPLEESVPINDIESAVRAFATAPTWEEMLKHVRAPGHILPQLRAYHDKHAMIGAEDVEIQRAVPVDVNGLSLFKVEVELLPSGKPLIAMVERDPHGHLKVDWEVAVDYQVVDWQAFYDQRISEPVPMRLVYREGTYYNYEFEDRTRYQCYRLSYPDSDLPELNGYVEKGSDLDKSLQLLLTEEGKVVPAILSISYPEVTKDAAMVIIRDVVAEGWVIDYEAESTSSSE